MFSWLVRIASYVLAAVAMIRLMQATDTVHFQPIFIAWLDRLRAVVDLGVLFDFLKLVVIDPALNYIRSFGWNLPTLQEHWRQVFVIVWLFAAAIVRNFSNPEEFRQRAYLAAMLFLTVLPFAIFAGFFPLGPGTPLLVFAACYATGLATDFFNAHKSSRHLYIRVAARVAVVTVVGATATYFLPDPFGPAIDLMVAAAVVALFAVFLIALTFRNLKRGYTVARHPIDHPSIQTAADILAAMALAFAAVAFLSDPPLVKLWG